MLSEGYCIYNGSPKNVLEYFSKFGLKTNHFFNPADKLSIIASEPKRILNQFITIKELAEKSSFI